MTKYSERERRCMWPGCSTHAALIDEHVDICRPHATIVHDRVEAPKRLAEEQRKVNAALIDQGIEPPPGQTYDRKWVYYILVDDHIKIGYTGHLWERLGAYPPNAQLLGAELGGRTVERRRHDQFHVYLSYGREWFRDVPEIRDHIASLSVPDIVSSIKSGDRMRPGPGNTTKRTRPLIKPRSWR
jgi:hypothetical protein